MNDYNYYTDSYFALAPKENSACVRRISLIYNLVALNGAMDRKILATMNI